MALSIGSRKRDFASLRRGDLGGEELENGKKSLVFRGNKIICCFLIAQFTQTVYDCLA